MDWNRCLEWFKDLKIFSKLVSIITLMTFFLLLVGLTGYYFNKESNKRLFHVYDDDLMSVKLLNDIRAQNRANEANIYKLLFVPDPSVQQQAILDMNRRLALIEKDLSDYENTALDSFESKAYSEIKKESIEFTDVINKTMQLAIGGNKKQAVDYYITNANKITNTQAGFRELVNHAAFDAKNMHLKSEKAFSFQNKLIIVLILISLLVSVLLSLFITKLITKPLSLLAATSSEVAKGNLEIEPVKASSKDEIGELTHSFNLMTENIFNLVETEKDLRRREQLLREIMTSSMGSLNIEEILKTIVIQTGNLFKSDRCYFIGYDVRNKEYAEIKDYNVYLSSLNFKDLAGIKFTNEQMSPFTKILFDQKDIISANNIDELQLSEVTKKLFFKDNGVKSALFVPVFHRNNPLGILVIDYINDYKEFLEDDISLLLDIASQSALFIYQAGLYSQLEDAVDREKLLRVVINQVLVSENIDEAAWHISKEICKIFDADRVSLRFFDPFQKMFTNVTGEYRKDESVPTVKDKGAYTREVNEYVIRKVFEEKENLIINDINSSQYPEYLRENFKIFGIKSAILAPIFHRNIPLGLIAIANTESYKRWEKEDVDLLCPIIQQISIGINLFNLNNKLSKSLEGEKIARKIITEIRKSEDHDLIYSYLLEQLTNIFNVSRAIHLHYDENYNFIVHNENLKDGNLKALLKEEIKSEIGKMFVTNGFAVINDVEKEVKNQEFKDYLEDAGIKSLLVYSANEEFIDTIAQSKLSALTIICSSTPREWLTEEIDTFKLICDSAAIVYLEIKQKKEVEEMRSTFIATLTHDLRSPIIAEQKAIEFMLSKGLDMPLKNYAEYIEDIHKTNEDLLGIVNNLLAVYHYELGRFDLSLESADLSQMVDEDVKHLRHLAADMESEIIINIPETLPLAYIDKNEINRVIVNLISNAIKHNKKGTKITIAAEKIDQTIQVSISDNGEGIPESEIPTIFQKYPTTKRKVGTGLGLYLSKQIIDAHNCKIWFVTTPGKGTSFFFTLPIAKV